MEVCQRFQVKCQYGVRAENHAWYGLGAKFHDDSLGFWLLDRAGSFKCLIFIGAGLPDVGQGPSTFAALARLSEQKRVVVASQYHKMLAEPGLHLASKERALSLHKLFLYIFGSMSLTSS